MQFRLGILLLLAGAVSAQNIVVDATPSHAVNAFSPVRSLGGAIDRLRRGTTKGENEKHTERLLTGPALKELLGAGWQTVTYRQNTELMIEAWHWNPRGTWSNAARQEGYFTGSPEPTGNKILHSWAYPLPHRGATKGDGNGWSRLTDGDAKSYWKSNPYLTKSYTGDDDALHPQWVMIDFRRCRAIYRWRPPPWRNGSRRAGWPRGHIDCYRQRSGHALPASEGVHHRASRKARERVAGGF